MTPGFEPRDCPLCRSAGSIFARVAAEDGFHDGPVGEACRRAEILLERLRNQFLSDVVLGTHQPASER
jgi:hypothetical protein